MRVVRWRPHKGICFLEPSLGGAFMPSSFGWGSRIFCLEILPMVASSRQICSPAVGGPPPTSYHCPNRNFVSPVSCVAGKGPMGKPDRCGHLGVHVLFIWAIELAAFALYPTRRLREVED